MIATALGSAVTQFVMRRQVIEEELQRLGAAGRTVLPTPGGEPLPHRARERAGPKARATGAAPWMYPLPQRAADRGLARAAGSTR